MQPTVREALRCAPPFFNKFLPIKLSTADPIKLSTADPIKLSTADPIKLSATQPRFLDLNIYPSSCPACAPPFFQQVDCFSFFQLRLHSNFRSKNVHLGYMCAARPPPLLPHLNSWNFAAAFNSWNFAAAFNSWNFAAGTLPPPPLPPTLLHSQGEGEGGSVGCDGWAAEAVDGLLR
eukprot:COSAG06_NODE_67_length_26084_cov_784.027670_17_plen_177_part_00